MSSNIRPPIQLSTATEESPESSYVDPAKGGPRKEAPARSSGVPLARRAVRHCWRGKRKDVDAPLALTTRRGEISDKFIG